MTEQDEQDIETIAGILADILKDMPFEARGALLIRAGQKLEEVGQDHTGTVLRNAGAMHHSPGLSRAIQIALKMKSH